MNDKLLIIGEDTSDIKKLLLKLFTAEAESAESISVDKASFVCVESERSDVVEQMNTLGYKMVAIAYADELVNKEIGNGDLEKYGYKFEDGM